MERSDGSPDRSVLVVGLVGRVYGKDRATGRTLWEHQVAPGYEVELAVFGDRVFAAAGNSITAIDYPSGRVLGSTPIPGRAGRTTLLVDGQQVFASKMGELSCFDWNGQLLWHDPMTGKGIGAISMGLPGNVRQADAIS